MSAHVVPLENFVTTLRPDVRRARARNDEYTPIPADYYEPPIKVNDHHYVEYIWWAADDLNLDPKTVSVLMDMWETPGKYEGDFRQWMDEIGEADYDRRMG